MYGSHDKSSAGVEKNVKPISNRFVETANGTYLEPSHIGEATIVFKDQIVETKTIECKGVLYC